MINQSVRNASLKKGNALGRSLALVALSLLPVGLCADVVPGVWNEDFTASKAYSDETGIPLVVVWGNQSCGYCNNLAEAIEMEPTVTWVAEHPVILCCKHDPYQAIKSKYSADFLAAQEWIKSLDENSLSGNPYVGVYWAKNTSGAKVSRAFTGRIGDMPVTVPLGTSNYILSLQFANSLDALIGDYEQTVRGEFAMGDTETDHLEANGTVSTVGVPFTRTMSSKALVEKLIVSYPSALSLPDETFAVNWMAGEETLVVAVPVHWAETAVGQSATLTYRDSDGHLIATSHIRYVDERACSVSYPRFVGEGFAYGEWTMDYAAAKARAAQDGGYVLALFTGTMWCPYCYGLDAVFKDARFIAWARDNRVSLVTFDQGLASSPSTAEGTLQARLLSYTAGTDHYKEGQDPAGAGVLRSGAYYMSGKGISSAAAASARALTTKYTEEFLSPESTGARCGNPTLLLVRNDKVVGRVATLRSGYVYNADETIARLADVLALNARADENDDYRTATTQEIVADSNRVYRTDLQISRRTAWYRVSDEDGAGNYTFAVKGKTSGETVSLAVYVGETCEASGDESVSVNLGTRSFESGVTLKVSAYADASRTVCTGGETSIFTVTLGATCESGGSGDEDGPGFDPEGKPCFGWETYDITLWKGFAADESFNVVNVEDARKVSLTKRSGTLPSGLKLAYDKTLERAVLSGTPRAVTAAASAWAVTGRFGSKNVTGESSEFAIVVADPALYNPYLGTSRTASIPLLTKDGYFAGTLTVSITAKNAISAKYAGTESKTISFSGVWSGLDEKTGTVSAEMVNAYATVGLTMDAEGTLRAVFEAPAGYSYFVDDGDVRLTGSSALAAEGDFSAYRGYYTVTLPVRDSDAVLSGTGTLTLKMTGTSAARKGSVTYTGTMPNGTAISGSATLSQAAESGCALLPVFVRKGKDVFAALLQIKANAAETWGSSGSDKIQSVCGASTPYLLHRETRLSCLVATEAYGGYYETGTAPLALTAMHGLDPVMTLTVDSSEAGTVTATARGLTISDAKGVSLSFTKSTGAFSGRASVVNSVGRTVTGQFKGVLMPGWTGCGACGEETVVRPFGSGTLYYADRIDGGSVTVSVPVDIVATELE